MMKNQNDVLTRVKTLEAILSVLANEVKDLRVTLESLPPLPLPLERRAPLVFKPAPLPRARGASRAGHIARRNRARFWWTNTRAPIRPIIDIWPIYCHSGAPALTARNRTNAPLPPL